MQALAFLKSLPHLPVSRESGNGPCRRPSNSELRRWLEKGSVRINHERPGPADEIVFPITELIFFSGAKSQTTFQS